MVSQHLMSHFINEDGNIVISEICEKCWYDKSMDYDIIVRQMKQYMRLDEWPASLVRTPKVGSWWMLANPSSDTERVPQNMTQHQIYMEFLGVLLQNRICNPYDFSCPPLKVA